MIKAKDITAADITFLAEIDADKVMGRFGSALSVFSEQQRALIHQALVIQWQFGFTAGATTFARGLEELHREAAAAKKQ